MNMLDRVLEIKKHGVAVLGELDSRLTERFYLSVSTSLSNALEWNDYLVVKEKLLALGAELYKEKVQPDSRWGCGQFTLADVHINVDFLVNKDKRIEDLKKELAALEGEV